MIMMDCYRAKRQQASKVIEENWQGKGEQSLAEVQIRQGRACLRNSQTAADYTCCDMHLRLQAGTGVSDSVLALMAVSAPPRTHEAEASAGGSVLQAKAKR